MDSLTENENKIWDFILEHEIATEHELILVTCINGYNVETLNNIIYACTGYRNMEQLKELGVYHES
jgi:hypothetical protein